MQRSIKGTKMPPHAQRTKGRGRHVQQVNLPTAALRLFARAPSYFLRLSFTALLFSFMRNFGALVCAASFFVLARPLSWPA